MKRNSKLSASLHALVHMAQTPGRAMTSEEIAAWLHTNPVVVRRMVAGLRDAGILHPMGPSENGPPSERACPFRWQSATTSVKSC